FRQITAEQLTAHKTRRGYIRLEWEVIKGRQNHALDARVYARAAAVLAGVDRTNDRDWEAREKFLGVGQTEAAAAAAARPRTAPPRPSGPPAGGADCRACQAPDGVTAALAAVLSCRQSSCRLPQRTPKTSAARLPTAAALDR